MVEVETYVDCGGTTADIYAVCDNIETGVDFGGIETGADCGGTVTDMQAVCDSIETGAAASSAAT